MSAARPRGAAHTSRCCSKATTPVRVAPRMNRLRSMSSLLPGRNAAGRRQLAREPRPRNVSPTTNLFAADLRMDTDPAEQSTGRAFVRVQRFQQFRRTMPYFAAHRRGAIEDESRELTVDVVEHASNGSRANQITV